MDRGNTIFYGTAGVGLPCLQSLARDTNLKLIITQPDARSGRSRKLSQPPVKTFALEKGIPCIQPEVLRCEASEARIREARADIAVVIAYGRYIPRAIARIPRCRTINVHFSLLPRWRGAAPVQRTLEAGETVSGVTIFEIRPRMDAGPIWSRRSLEVAPHETAPQLFDRLSRMGSELLMDTIPRILGGDESPEPQNHRDASQALPLRKEEGRIDWSLSARTLFNRWRGFQPWPGLFFKISDLTVRVLSCAPCGEDSKGVSPGTVLEVTETGMLVACGSGEVLRLDHIQPQCKRPMSPHCFSLGNKIPDRLS